MGHPQQGQGHHYQQAGHQGGYAPVPQQQQAPVAVGAGANMKRRNPVGAWLGLPLITLGIWPLVMWVKLGGRIAAAQRAAGLQPTCSGGIGFLLGVIGFGVLYYQIQLNKVVDRYGATPPGQQVSLVA